MNTGKQTVEWLFNEQLKVDEEWAVRTHNAFRWWADKNAQTVEVIGQEVGPDGDIGYIVSVRTELLRSVDLNDCTLATALKHFDLDQVYMRPVVREFLERIPKQ